MILNHYFHQRTATSPFKSRYSLFGDDGEQIIDTGSSVKMLRVLRKLGCDIPKEMHGAQVQQYEVKIATA